MNAGPWQNGANNVSVRVPVNSDSVMETPKNCAPEVLVMISRRRTFEVRVCALLLAGHRCLTSSRESDRTGGLDDA